MPNFVSGRLAAFGGPVWRRTKNVAGYFSVIDFLLMPALVAFSLSLVFSFEYLYFQLGLFLFVTPLTLWRPILGLLAMVFSLPLFEHPVLVMGFPNQFAIEGSLLGFACGEILRRAWRCWGRNRLAGKQILEGDVESPTDGRLFLHPFFIPLLFLCVFAASRWAISLWDILPYSSEGISKRKLASMIGRHVWRWNIIDGPVHQLSIGYGFGLQVLAMHSGIRTLRTARSSGTSIINALMSASILVYVYSWGQQAGHISKSFTPDLGGTFQNGNHLSYYASLILMVSLAGLVAAKNHLVWRLVHGLTILASLFFLLAGRGRVAWVATGSTLVVMAVVSLFVALRRKSIPPMRLAFGGIGTLIASAAVVWVSWKYLHLSRFHGVRELRGIWSKLDWTNLHEIILAGGRRRHTLEAVDSLGTNLWSGLGYGNFYKFAASRLEIHNVPLSWLVEVGLPVGVLVSLVLLTCLGWIFFRAILQILRSSTGRFPWALVIVSALAFHTTLSIFPDAYASFRSILGILSILFVWALVQYPGPDVSVSTSPSSNYTKPLLAIIGLALISSLSLAFSPISTQPPAMTWGDEKSSGTRLGKFAWNGPFLSRLHKEDRCMAVQIHGVFPRGHATYRYGSYAEGDAPSRWWNLTKMENFSEEWKSGSVTLENGRWHDLCLCPKSGGKAGSHRIYLMSNRGEHLSLSRHGFGPDDRFISFGRSPETYVENGSAEFEGICGQVLHY